VTRLHDLTSERLDDLPDACRACAFWESTSREPGPTADVAGARDAKAAWWQAVTLDWGTPGKAVYHGDELVAYALFAPGDHIARARHLGRGVSDDALLLATVWVHPAHRDGGLGKALLVGALRETHRRGSRALEAYAARRGARACMLDEAFLLANGFTVLAEHARYPLLRLELRQTVRESLTHALEGVASALARRERTPVPARSPTVGAPR
jgi:GNAT superfamily N-acetyltransferase